jgi:hypothetical protein
MDEEEEYSLAELVPIPAKCSKCKRVFLGRDAIRAPSLACCSCFYCHGKLIPHPDHKDFEDAQTRRRKKRDGLFWDCTEDAT